MKKRINILLVLCIALITFVTQSAFAINDEQKSDEFLEFLKKKYEFDLNKTQISYDESDDVIKIDKGMENYVNLKTHEYFIVRKKSERSTDVAREFDFEIRRSLVGPDFYLGSDSIEIEASSKLYHASGRRVYDYDVTSYYITLSHGVLRKKETARFPINDSQTSYFGNGWSTSRAVHLEIDADGDFDSYNYYLVGSGTVYNR